jgi:hypothetical protein
VRIEEGLDFIEEHFELPIYPRRIATFATGERQVQANNRDEALARFKAIVVITSSPTNWNIIAISAMFAIDLAWLSWHIDSHSTMSI